MVDQSLDSNLGGVGNDRAHSRHFGHLGQFGRVGNFHRLGYFRRVGHLRGLGYVSRMGNLEPRGHFRSLGDDYRNWGEVASRWRALTTRGRSREAC